MAVGFICALQLRPVGAWMEPTLSLGSFRRSFARLLAHYIVIAARVRGTFTCQSIDHRLVGRSDVARSTQLDHLYKMARIPADRFTWPWGEADKCPCGSEKIYANCCRQGVKKFPYVALPCLLPPLPVTGYSNPGCYLASTENCSDKISREHYVSKAILQQFPGLVVSGCHWMAPGEERKIGIEALTVKILCTRHNSALAPLDSFALRAFQAFDNASDYVSENLHPGRPRHYLISGDALELWMIKLMCGMYFGGLGAEAGIAVKNIHAFDLATATNALSGGRLSPGRGMFLTQGVETVMKKAVWFAPLTDITKRETVGIQVGFGALRFETLIVKPPPSILAQMIAEHRYRPGIMDFNGIARDARVAVSWRGQGNSVSRIGFQLEPTQ